MCVCVRVSFLLRGKGFVQCTYTRPCFGCRKKRRCFSTFSTSVCFRPFSTFKSTQMFCRWPFSRVTVFVLSLPSRRAVSTDGSASRGAHTWQMLPIRPLCNALHCTVWRQWLGKRSVTVGGLQWCSARRARMRRRSGEGNVTGMPSAAKCSQSVALECWRLAKSILSVNEEVEANRKWLLPSHYL